jgi:hypothetical protein
MSTTTAPAVPVEQPKGGVVLGYVMAILMPLVGFIIGVVLATRPDRRSKHGWRVIAVSCVAFTIYLALIISAANSAVNQVNTQLNSYSQCINNAQTLAQMDKC